MTGRLLSWPVGLRANFREPLSGPRAVGANSSQSLSGFVQTTAAAFGLWRWRFQFPPLRGDAFRRYRGWITALHGGANATRIDWCEWDQMSFAARGIQTTSERWRAGEPWSSGVPWSNGQNWRTGNPMVAVAAAAASGTSVISLAAAFWGRNLSVGDMVGFQPFHFGWYMITDVIEPGRYRIWPPLGKAIATNDLATLNPTMAARLEGEEAAAAARGPAFAEGLSITLVQTLDYDVRDFFTG